MAVANNTQDGFVVIGVNPPASASHEPIFGELVDVSWEEIAYDFHTGVGRAMIFPDRMQADTWAEIVQAKLPGWSIVSVSVQDRGSVYKIAETVSSLYQVEIKFLREQNKDLYRRLGE